MDQKESMKYAVQVGGFANSLTNKLTRKIDLTSLGLTTTPKYIIIYQFYQ